MQRGNFDLRAKRRLRKADRNRAVEIGAAPLEKRVLFHFEKNIEIARRAAVRARLALPGHAQARAGIDAGGNADFERALALDAPLAAARVARVADHLARALASRAGARDGEKSLLVGHLAAAAAGAAGGHAGAGLGAGAFAGFAILAARQCESWC